VGNPFGVRIFGFSQALLHFCSEPGLVLRTFHVIPHEIAQSCEPGRSLARAASVNAAFNSWPTRKVKVVSGIASSLRTWIALTMSSADAAYGKSSAASARPHPKGIWRGPRPRAAGSGSPEVIQIACLGRPIFACFRSLSAVQITLISDADYVVFQHRKFRRDLLI